MRQAAQMRVTERDVSASRQYWIVLSHRGANSNLHRRWFVERQVVQEFATFLEGLVNVEPFDLAMLYDHDPLEGANEPLAYVSFGIPQ